jgi:hypothetical protein
VKSIRLGFCVTVGVAAGIVLACYPGAANAAERAFEMKAYVDFPGGREVIAGDYAGAVQAASRKADKAGVAGMIANTNLCVAFTKTRQFSSAEAACSKAVTLAERRDVSAPRLQYAYVTRQDIATALSNRGVFKAVSGDLLAAARDFREAAGIARADVGLPRRNLAYLEASTSDRVAMNKGAPRRQPTQNEK